MSTKALSSSQSPIIQGEIFTSTDHKKRLQISGLESKTFAVAVKVLNSGNSTETVKLKWHQRVIVWLRSIWWTEATVQDKSGQFHKVLINTNSLAKRLNLHSSENLATIDPLNIKRKDILIDHGYSLREIHEIENGIQKSSNQNPNQPFFKAVYSSENSSILHYRGKFGLSKKETADQITDLSTGETEPFFSFLTKEFDEKATKVFSALCRLDILNMKQRLQVAFQVDSASLPENTDPNVFVPIVHFNQAPDGITGHIAYKNNELYLLNASARNKLIVINLSSSSAQPETYGLILKQDLSEDEIQKNPFSAERQNEGSEPLSNYGYIKVKSFENEFSTYQVTSLPEKKGPKEKKLVQFALVNEVREFYQNNIIQENLPDAQSGKEKAAQPIENDEFDGFNDEFQG